MNKKCKKPAVPQKAKLFGTQKQGFCCFENFQLLHNRKAQMSWVVGIIILLIGFFLVWGIAGKVIKVIKEGGEEAACTASAQLSSKTKIAGVEAISLNCPMRLMEITTDDLYAEEGKATKALDRIEKYNAQQESEENKIKIEYFDKAQSNETKLREFVLDTKVAEEMRQCWFKLGEGELDLFHAWYNPLALKEMPWIKMKILPTIKTPPITCVICSRIKFDSKVQRGYPEKVTSINEWLKINTVKGREITYYDYLIDEVHDQFLFQPDWEFSTKEPIAVVFARMNPQKSVGWLKDMLNNYGVTALGEAQDAVDVLYLMEYSKVGEYCNYLANKPPEED